MRRRGQDRSPVPRLVARGAAGQGGWAERPAGEAAGRVLQLVGAVVAVHHGEDALDRSEGVGEVRSFLFLVRTGN